MADTRIATKKGPPNGVICRQYANDCDAVSEAIRNDVLSVLEIKSERVCDGCFQNTIHYYSTRNQNRHTNRKRTGMRRNRRTTHFSVAGMTTIIALFGLSTLAPSTIIRETKAFNLISPVTITRPTSTKTCAEYLMDGSNRHRHIHLQQQQHDRFSLGYPSLSPTSPQFGMGRIRHHRRGIMTPVLYSTPSADNDSESSQAKKKIIQKSSNDNTKGNINSNKKNSSRKTSNPNKKIGKGGNKQRKTKSSSPSSPPATRKPKSKPDPSDEKKREIMEQIKAKIKEEGEEKKRKQQQQQQQKQKKQDSNPQNKQQQQQQNQNQKQSQPKESSPSQARLQNLAEDDITESLFDDGAEADPNEGTKRKKLFMNPFEAGKSFRETLNNLSTLSRGLQLPKETKDKYFLDDRLLDDDDSGVGPNTGALFSSSPLLSSNFNSKTANSLLQDYAKAEALAPTAYIPEVLVVGATGEIGRLVVRRLLLEGRGRFRVRVLVRDLYSQTLNLLGTGVSYCQGDLSNVESLEYALTDVDKIVYVAGAPKPDESDFQRKFRWYLEENDVQLSSSSSSSSLTTHASQDGDPKIPQPPTSATAAGTQQTKLDDLEWEQLASVLEVRSELAEQVDCIGMKNLVSAYQNVRHTDYGTSQAAKRSLFKFSKKSGDFDLFALDDGEDDDKEDIDDADRGDKNEESYSFGTDGYDEDAYNEEYNYGEEFDEDKYEDEDEYADEYDKYDEDYGVEPEARNPRDSNVVKAQVRWLRNKFDNGVFVGRVPRADANNPGGEASIISSRLRAREDPEQGIDMSNFNGFILRVVSDGNHYEAFARTSLYETDGIEYVYEYSTDSKKPTADNKSQSRFKTIRLAFENFKPVVRRNRKRDASDDCDCADDYDEEHDEENDEDEDVLVVPPFVGSDVRYLGFRFRSSSNIRDTNRMQNRLDRLSSRGKESKNGYQRFYMALAYIKVYRAQPEPEFIYLSDARIPPVIHDGMVHHQRKMLLTDPNPVSHGHEEQQHLSLESDEASASTLLDEKDLQRRSRLERSPEETYFKYRGEEILIKSGLSYTIIRVAGFNELSTSEASTIDLVKTNTETSIVPVSRAEVAQVCVSALLDPCALNKCVYMTKKRVDGKNVLDEEDISAKFDEIPTDIIL